MKTVEAAFAETINAMVTAMLDAGADPLAVGAVRVHAERMGFMLERIDAKLDRITRQETRQKGQNRQQPTKTNVVQFPKVKRDVPDKSRA